MASTEFNSIDDWLNYRGGTDRTGGGFLKSWKKDGKITVWLHTKRLPVAVWMHQFPEKKVWDDKDSGEARIAFWGQRQVCHETTAVLKKQFKRRNGEREVPPVACPLCRTIEAVRGMVESGELKWTDKIFVFKGATDAKDNSILHAGGLYNAFGGELDDDEKEDLKEHGIRLTEAWRENAQAKEQSVFCVVNNEHPEDGVQITTETGLLGDKVKGVINDEIASKGDKGNPVLNPYAIEWIFRDDRGLSFDKKYHARRIDRFDLTDEIEELITGDPPDLKSVTTPFDRDTMRATMEKYAVVDLPWDEIFRDETPEDEQRPRAKAISGGSAKRPPKPAESEPAPKRDAKAKRDDQEPEEKTGRRRRGTPVQPPKREARPSEEFGDPCDECGAAMLKDATTCAKCGAQYENEDEKPAKRSSEPADDLDDGEIPF